MDDLLAIGEFSELTGLSPKRLRSYAAAGLLIPAAVDASSGYRYYAPGQVRAARLIDALREADVPLAEIASLLRDPSAQKLDVWTSQVQSEAVQRQEALKLARRLLQLNTESVPASRTSHTGKAALTMLNIVSRSEIGPVRDNNEDAVMTNDHLGVVADGMGGQPGGEVAAALAVSVVQASYSGRSIDELEAGIRAANRAIWERAGVQAELEGMGSTVCAVGLTAGGELAIVNVGDSRAYVQQEGTVRQVTADHSLTADLVRRGELAERDAREHPLRGVITRVLGGGPDVEVDGALHTVRPGDRVLLCTDGLFNELRDEEIVEVLAASGTLNETVDRLVEMALDHGARDNVSVVLAEVTA